MAIVCSVIPDDQARGTSVSPGAPSPSLSAHTPSRGFSFFTVALGLGFLHLGVSAQLLGVSLFLGLFPLLVYAKYFSVFDKDLSCNHFLIRRYFWLMSVTLAGLWVLFPLWSLLNSFYHPGDYELWVWSKGPVKSWQLLFKSPLSSAFLFASATCAAIAWLFKRHSAGLGRCESKWHLSSAPAPFTYPHLATVQFIITLVFSLYLIVQHFWGFDFRAAHFTLAPEHKMPSGRYRTFGFYGHPLSLASVSLFLWVFWLYMFLKRGGKRAVALFLMSFGALVSTGGRTALLVAMVMGVGLWLLPLFKERNHSWRHGVLAPSLFLAVSAFMVVKTGFWGRVLEFFVNKERSGIGENRFIFWQVHWSLIQDSPLVGWGTALLHAGFREQAYVWQGYAQLKDKFNAHQIFLETWAQVGLGGALILLFTLLVLSRCFLRLMGVFSNAKDTALMGRAFAFGVLANFLHGLTQNTFFDANVTAFYLGYFSLILWIGLQDLVHQRQSPGL